MSRYWAVRRGRLGDGRKKLAIVVGEDGLDERRLGGGGR